MTDRIYEFLFQYQIHPDSLDIGAISDSFFSEMIDALKGQTSSLSMFRSYLPVSQKITSDLRITSVDVGGTHLRVADVAVSSEGMVTIEKLDRFSMLGIDREINADTFFLSLAEMIHPYTLHANAIGISFAFPGRITPDHDMIIEDMAKEIKICDIQGKSLAEGLNHAFEQLFHKQFSITSVNDTVASFLASAFHQTKQSYRSKSGLVIGTGTNSCYLHYNASCCYFDVINVESGRFNGYTGGAIDHLLDLESAMTGDHIFEKMTGGKYLGQLFRLICEKATQERLLPLATLEKLDGFFTSRQLSELLESDDEHKIQSVVHQIGQALIHRAAKLIAANLDATIRMQHGENKPALIVYEGSTVTKMHDYLELIKQELLTVSATSSIDFVTQKDAVLIGAAKAAALVYSENV